MELLFSFNSPNSLASLASSSLILFSSTGPASRESFYFIFSSSSWMSTGNDSASALRCSALIAVREKGFLLSKQWLISMGFHITPTRSRSPSVLFVSRRFSRRLLVKFHHMIPASASSLNGLIIMEFSMSRSSVGATAADAQP